MDLNSALKAMYSMPTAALVPKESEERLFPRHTTDRRMHRRWKRQGIGHTFKRWTTDNSERIAALKKPLLFTLNYE